MSRLHALSMPSSNRLLDIFHSESREDACSRTGSSAPAAGETRCYSHFPASVHATTRHVTEEQHGVGLLKAKRVGTRKLQRDNERLKEQLRFQGAVIDQLARDVHNLELKQTKNAAHFSSGPVVVTQTTAGKGGMGGECRDDDDNNARLELLTGSKQPVLPAHVGNKESGCGEQENDYALLRLNVKEARARAENLRQQLAAEQTKARQAEQAHVDLLSRERKFRTAIEAGLREKVHSLRRRSRDTDERLSTELSFTKTQLKEAIDFLATEEEGAGLLKLEKTQQDERHADAITKLKERDRQVHWLERRLAEVSRHHVAENQACMEEMAASLAAQQRELESFRTTSSNGSSKKSTSPMSVADSVEVVHRENARLCCCTKLRADKWDGDGGANSISVIRATTRQTEDITTLKVHKEGDNTVYNTEEAFERSPQGSTARVVPSTLVLRGEENVSEISSPHRGEFDQTSIDEGKCSNIALTRIRQAISCGAGQRVTIESHPQGTPVAAKAELTPACAQESAISPRMIYRSVGTDSTADSRSSIAPGRSAVRVRDEAPQAGPTQLMKATRPARILDLLEWLLNPLATRPPDPPPSGCSDRSPNSSLSRFSAGLIRAPHSELEPTLIAGVAPEAIFWEQLRREMSAKVSKKVEVELKQASRRHQTELEQKQAKREQRESAWEEQAKVWQSELFTIGQVSAIWEKEAIALKVERQTVIRRLQRAEKDAADQSLAVAEERKVASRATSQLVESQKACRKLKRELGRHLQAGRALEKRATHAEATLSDATSARRKAERTKILLKACLTGNSACKRDATCQVSFADIEHHHQCRRSDRVLDSNSSVAAAIDVAIESITSGSLSPKGQHEHSQVLNDAQNGPLIQVDDSGRQTLHATRGKELDLMAGIVQISHLRTGFYNGNAERRLELVKQSWRDLAQTVVALANQNADLEQAILHLRRQYVVGDREFDSERPLPMPLPCTSDSSSTAVGTAIEAASRDVDESGFVLMTSSLRGQSA